MNAKSECEYMVLGFFGGDWKKVLMWFTTPNGLFGGVSPHVYATMRGHDRLKKIIKARLAENKEPNTKR